MSSIEYRHIHGAAMIAARGATSTSTLKVPPGFDARHVVLTRPAWEAVGVRSVSFAERPLPAVLRQVVQEKVIDLPPSDLKAARPLVIEWVNIGPRAYHLHYTVTEEPREGAVPATVRVPQVVDMPVDDGPASELEETIASSFQLPVMKFRTIVTRLAQRAQVTPQAMLDFFGHDGYTTIDQDMIQAVSKRAGELSLNANELLAAKVFQGVAVAISEKGDFDRLMVEGGGGAGRKDDFRVSSTVGGPGEAPTVADVPNALPQPIDGARMNELARWFKVDPSWLVTTIKTIADLRGQSPEDLVRLMSLSMVRALRAMFISVVSAPDDPVLEEAKEARRGGSFTEDRSAALNQGIATRSIDSVAEAKRQGSF